MDCMGPNETNYTNDKCGLGLQSKLIPHHSVHSLLSNDHSEGGWSSGTDVDEETELQTRPNSLSEAANMSSNFIKRKTSQILQVVTGSSKIDVPFPLQLAALVDAYTSSEIASSLRSEVNRCFH